MSKSRNVPVPAKARKPAAKAAPAHKTAKVSAKAGAKAPAKVAAKTPAKVAAKAPAKAPAKAAATAHPKVTAKVHAKVPAKVTPKISPKVIAKATPAARASGRPSVDKPPALSAKHQVYFERLMALRDQMVDEIRTLSDQSLSANKQAGEELADIGSENFLREMELGLVNEENKKIILVQEAFERLRNGTYGTCLDCNRTIGEGRLEAIPYAKLCVNCKGRREQEEAGAAELVDAEETGSDEEEAELTE